MKNIQKSCANCKYFKSFRACGTIGTATFYCNKSGKPEVIYNQLKDFGFEDRAENCEHFTLLPEWEVKYEDVYYDVGVVLKSTVVYHYGQEVKEFLNKILPEEEAIEKAKKIIKKKSS